MFITCAVGIIFAVGFVVLMIVGDQILQGEAVVRGDKIDAGPGFASAAIEKITRSGQPSGQVGELPVISLPVGPSGIAVAVIPFSPPGRELPYLIPAWPNIPRLRN